MLNLCANLIEDMRSFNCLKIGALLLGALIAPFALFAQKPVENPGLPARTTPADYQAKGQVGKVTIAAEFTAHSVPTAQGPLTAEDYVVVETAFFGAADARLVLSSEDFTLRINGNKKQLPSQPFGIVSMAVKDPEYVPEVPVSAGPKSKGGISGGGGGQGQGQGEPPPSPPPIPIEVRRAMAQRVMKSALPEGDRALPQAGLLFFQYRGKAEGIHSVELIYSGPAGKATIVLQR